MMDFKKVINYSKFKYLLVSQFFSQLAIQFLNFTFLIKLSIETNSPFASSLLWAFYSLPALFIGPFSSLTVDIFDKRKILIYSNLFQSVIVFLLSLVFNKSIFMLFAAAFFYSLINQFYIPAETASMTSILKKNDYVHGNSLFFFSTQSTLIIGFLLAGPLHAIIGFRNSILFASAMLFVAYLSVIKLPILKNSKKVIDVGDSFKDFFDKIMEGYRFIKNNNKVKTLFIYMIYLQILLTIVLINIPFLSKDILLIRPEVGGVFLIIPTIIGALTSVLMYKKIFYRLKSSEENIIKFFSYLLSGSLFFISLIIPYITISSVRYLSFLTLFFICGFSFVCMFLTIQTSFQKSTPNILRGRTFGNYWFVLTIATLFPIVFSGIASELFGIKTLISFFALTIILFYVKFKNSLIENNISD